MYVLQHVHFWELQKLEEGVKPCGYWELNPLQEQQVLFTAVTSIQNHIFHHKKKCNLILLITYFPVTLSTAKPSSPFSPRLTLRLLLLLFLYLQSIYIICAANVFSVVWLFIGLSNLYLKPKEN